MNKLWIIIQEVYRKNVKSWAFFFMVVGPILMIALIGAVSYFIGRDAVSSTQGTIGLIGFESEISQRLEQGDQPNQLEAYDSMEAANQALHAGKIDGYLVEESQDPLIINYYRQKQDKEIRLGEIEDILADYTIEQEAEQLGLNHQEVIKLQQSTVNINETTLELDDSGHVMKEKEKDLTDAIAMGVAYFVCFMVFMFIVTYSSMIGQEVANEKGSRIMEIILSSVSATTHFFGKIFGIALVILTQIASYLAIGLVVQLVLKLSGLSRLVTSQLEAFGVVSVWELLAPSRRVIGLGLVFAVIGIIIYSSLSAFLGSLASNLEDVQKSMAPMTLLAVAGFYIGMYAMTSTNNIVVRIGSFIPFWSPFIMPFRISAETVSTLEISLAIIGSFVFALLVLWFSVIFYRSNVLVTSDKGIINTLKNSWSLWRSEREANRIK